MVIADPRAVAEDRERLVLAVAIKIAGCDRDGGVVVDLQPGRAVVESLEQAGSAEVHEKIIPGNVQRLEIGDERAIARQRESETRRPADLARRPRSS